MTGRVSYGRITASSMSSRPEMLPGVPEMLPGTPEMFPEVVRLVLVSGEPEMLPARPEMLPAIAAVDIAKVKREAQAID